MEEGTWINYNTGQNVDKTIGGTVDGGITQNCGALISPWNGWHDWSCLINSEVKITCACEHPEQMYLQLRGLCPESRLDRYCPKLASISNM